MASSIKKIITEGTVWMSLGSFASKIIGMVYVVIVLTNLSVYQYGVVELLLTIPALLSFLNFPGLELATIADIGYEKGRLNIKRMYYIYGSYLSVRFMLGFVGWVMLFFGASLISSYYGEVIVDMIRIISFTFLLSPLRSAFFVVFKVSLRFKVLAGYRFAEEVGKLAVLIVALLVFHMGPVSVIIAYIGADVVALLSFSFFFLSIKKKLFQSSSLSPGWKNPLFMLKAHGKWSVFAAYLSMFGQNIRPWIVKAFLGTEAVGIYGLAVGMYQHTASLFSISNVVGPIIPQYIDKKTLLYRLINTAVKYQLLVLTLSAALMALAFPVLIYMFFPTYEQAYLLYICMLPVLIPAGFTSIFEPTFHALKEQKNLFFAATLRFSLIVFVLPATLAVFGFYGIAFEFFITRAVYAYNRYRKLHILLPGYTFTLRDMLSVTDMDRRLLKHVYVKTLGRFV